MPQPTIDTAVDPYLPLRALSQYAGISVTRLRGYLTDRTKPLPYYRVGGKILVKRSDYDAWVASCRVEGVSDAPEVDALVAGMLSKY